MPFSRRRRNPLLLFPIYPDRTCKLRTGPTALVSRMRCASFGSAPSTAWRRRFWRRPSTNWMLTRRSSRRACLTRSRRAVSVGPSYRPFWSTRNRTRSGLVEAAALGGRGWVWSERCHVAHPPTSACALVPTSSLSPYFFFFLFVSLPLFSGFRLSVLFLFLLYISASLSKNPVIVHVTLLLFFFPPIFLLSLTNFCLSY